jgi:omega-hydroxy-beta-dihydromenaquinone-9 sulfotransferase
MANDQNNCTHAAPAIELACARKRPLFAAKFWHGMTLPPWLRLLARNRFAVAPRFLPAALGITAISLGNSGFAGLQALLLGRRVAQTEINQPPLFILGHWRSGTTLLQQLFAQDERFALPTAYECFAPKSSLVTSWFVTRWLRFLHSARRPMDNMTAGPEEPHEDEFALCSMGLPSPYTQLAFPNRPQREELLDFEGLSAAEVRRWQAGLLGFVRQTTWRSGGKPLVLKSPPHTARVRWLLELFPEARFVHIVRNPWRVFPSTVWLWKSLYRVHGLQRPRLDDLDEHVYRSLIRMYWAFWSQKSQIRPDKLCEVRYEDLVRDGPGQMQRIYEHLKLGEFAPVRPKIEQYFAREKDYRTNRYELSPETVAEISRRWGDFIREYGYGSSRPASTNAGEPSLDEPAMLATLG